MFLWSNNAAAFIATSCGRCPAFPKKIHRLQLLGELDYKVNIRIFMEVLFDGLTLVFLCLAINSRLNF
jgi:hypothetical protein